MTDARLLLRLARTSELHLRVLFSSLLFSSPLSSSSLLFSSSLRRLVDGKYRRFTPLLLRLAHLVGPALEGHQHLRDLEKDRLRAGTGGEVSCREVWRGPPWYF